MKGRYKKIFTVLILLVVAMLALSGCSGNDGSNGATGDTGATGTTGATGATGKDAATSVAALSTTDLTALAFSQTDSKVTGVTISSPPVVKFTLKDAAGRGITGLGFTSKSSTATIAGLTNIQFALAKLVPGTNGSPSRWVTYIVTTVPTTTTGVVPTRPATDNTGTLKDNGDGTYEYTFYRDITKVKDVVVAATVTAPNDVADLGDLTYDPTLTHRLVIQIGGNVRGTGSNTADGVTVTPGVPMANPINLVYDFVPAGGAVATQREIVKVANCFECHRKFSGIHGGDHLKGTPGSRQDTRYCVVCHTEQHKYGFAEATTTTTGYSGDTRKINGQAVGYFPAFIHRIHMGEGLTKTGYNFAGVLFNDITFPQDQRNCRKCHAGDTTAQLADTPQGNNWKTNPSRQACGACHDQVDFAVGTNHIGGRQSNDSLCYICHADVDIELYHIPVDVSSTTAAPRAAFQSNLPAGAAKITYDINSVTVAGTPTRTTVKFRILKDGTPVTFNTYAAGAELLPNFIGGPTIYLAYAVTQDGIIAPADFNATASITVKNLWDSTRGSLSAPDSSGYYTAVLGGGSTAYTGADIPSGAVMVTAGIGYAAFTQTNVPSFPYTSGVATSGLVLPATIVTKVATGYAPRRAIVETARCNKCHAQLGVTPTFHSGYRNDATTCAFCHIPNRTSSGWSARSSSYIHAIHGSEKRTENFTWASTSLTDGFWNVTFPGILRNCETCHLPGMYDFSSSVYTDTLKKNLLYSTVAAVTPSTSNPTGALNPSATTALSPYVTAGAIYGAGFSFSAGGSSGVTTPAAGTTLVTSPIATACFSCHDTSLVKAHMESNGGSVYARRDSASVLAKAEQCLLCHGTGKVADIKAMHIK